MKKNWEGQQVAEVDWLDQEVIADQGLTQLRKPEDLLLQND